MSVTVLVVGDDGINSLGVIRCLGEEGYKPVAIITVSKEKSVKLKKSKYLKTCIEVEKNENTLLKALLDYNTDGKQCYIIPTSDFVLKILSDNSDKLSDRYVFPSVNPSVGTLADVMSKTVMAEYAEKAGFTVPKMKKYEIKADYDCDEKLYGFFSDSYPLILKSDCIYVPGCDFIIVNNENELKTELSKYIENTIIIQQYIENAEEVAVQGVSFGDRQKTALFGVIHKIRTSLFAKGTTTYAELKPFNDNNSMDSKIKALVENYCSKLSFNGIFDMEMLLKNGNVYFIECNYRNGAYGYAQAVMGVNLPVLWLCSILMQDESFDIGIKHKLRNTIFVNDIGDFAHVLHGNVGIMKWLKQYVSADAHLTFNYKDQGPFWAELDILRMLRIFKNKRNRGK